MFESIIRSYLIFCAKINATYAKPQHKQQKFFDELYVFNPCQVRNSGCTHTVYTIQPVCIGMKPPHTPTASFLIIIFAVAQTVAEDYLVVIISAALRNVVNAVVANDLRISMQRVGQFAYVCPEYSSDFAYASSPGMPKAQHGVKLD